jgi:sugar phosphate isomerase/epimerase
MEKKGTSRRSFLKGTLIAPITDRLLAVPGSGQTGTAKPAPGKSIRLGGPIFTRTQDPEELALAHLKLGYRAAYCPNVDIKDGGRITALAAAFKKHDVVIAEVGRWVNLLDARPEARLANMKQVADGLALAEAIGALCCVDIAGSYSSTHWYGPHPENLSDRFFEEAVQNARKIIDAVKPKRAKFCYEMMGWSIPDSVDSTLRLIKAIDRAAFAVHLDPCNLINSPARFYRNADLLNECFDKLGLWIVSCHAKDLTWDVEMNVHFREVRPGAGSLDYRTYLRRLAGLPHAAPLMIEHLPNAEEYDKARQYTMDSGKANGIGFS